LPGVEQAKLQQLDRQIAIEHEKTEREKGETRPGERETPAAEKVIPEQQPAAKQVTSEPPAPLFDRDAAEREWNDRLIQVAIAYDQNREHQAGPAAVREFAIAQSQAERAASRPEQEKKPE
jgi:hypothetical protein